MDGQPDRELWDIVTAIQAGDDEARWLFSENSKIQAIIRGRMRQYRRMFPWIPEDTIQDVACSLRPKIISLASVFDLPEMPNDGRIISYFHLRIKGEADFILKKLTGMRQIVDEDGTVYFKSFDCSLDDTEGELIPSNVDYEDQIITHIDIESMKDLFKKIVDEIPKDSNDLLWLRCLGLKQNGLTWSDITEEVGYKKNDYALLRDNTARFVNRLRNKLLIMGKDISYRICGIYTDISEVAICVYDQNDLKKRIVWSKTYESFEDLEKIEAKIGDVLRQYDITYIVCNDPLLSDRANIIVMKYLSKREAFVYTVDLTRFRKLIPEMPGVVSGIKTSESHKCAYLLTQIKRAHLDYQRTMECVN